MWVASGLCEDRHKHDPIHYINGTIQKKEPQPESILFKRTYTVSCTQQNTVAVVGDHTVELANYVLGKLRFYSYSKQCNNSIVSRIHK